MILRFLGFSLIFCAVFLVTGFLMNTGLRQTLPAPHMGLMTERLKAFDAHKDEIDILFIGTSRTYRQVDTPLLEKALAQQGCGDLTAFNLGIQNLTAIETDYVVDHILAAKPARLKLAVIEEPMPAMKDLGRIRSDRSRYFSDLAGTRARLADIWSYQEDVPHKLWRSGLAVLGFVYEQSNLGHLSRLIYPDLYAAQQQEDLENTALPPDWFAVRGYLSLSEHARKNEAVRKRHENFAGNMKDFPEILQRQKESLPQVLPVSAGRIAYIRSLEDRFSDSGIKTMLYFPPLPDRLPANLGLAETLRREKPDLPMLQFNDPETWPEFWDIKLWFDDTHLDENGARMMTGKMAAPVCAAIRKAEK